MRCPACSENNEDGMQFCIYCGTAFAPAPSMSQSHAAHAIQSMQPVQPIHQAIQPAQMPMSNPQTQDFSASGVQNVLLYCTVCKKTDLLHATYCVFCGGRTQAGPAAQATESHGFSPTASQVLPNQSQMDSVYTGEKSRPKTSKAGTGSGSASGAGGIVSIIVSVLLGSALAILLAYYFREKIEESTLDTYFPQDGALIFSKSANADVEISDVKKKSIAFGKTSDKGTLHLLNLAPGSYLIKVTGSDGKTVSSKFSVNASDQNLVGYPKPLEPK